MKLADFEDQSGGLNFLKSKEFICVRFCFIRSCFFLEQIEGVRAGRLDAGFVFTFANLGRELTLQDNICRPKETIGSGSVLH